MANIGEKREMSVHLQTYVGHRLKTELTLAFLLRKVQFHIRDQFWTPRPKLHGACYFGFSEESKNELVWPLLMFLAILAKNRWFSDNSDTLANSQF